jgi:integrase
MPVDALPGLSGARSRRELKAALKKAKLPDLAFRFHALRHHAVSALIAEGARITLVSKVAGHASPDVTLRVYSHLLGEDLRAAADKYDPLREAV